MSRRKTLDLGTTDRGTVLRVPLELLTSVQTIVANRGRGKSWFARNLAEQASDVGFQFAAIDPTGVWWGIAAPWSKSEGQACDVVIFGGDQGHLPLLPEAGRRIAQFIVESRQNVVLDTSAMRKGKTHFFMAEFLEELFALKGRKSNRTPLHLFWDETEQSAPQRGSADQMRVLGAAEDCTKLGRSRGFGMTLLTQRPATLNKNLLDLSDTIYALGITSPRDKKAVLAFLEDDMPAEQLKLIKGSLASLPRGEAWAWSPRFDFFERFTVGQIRTYDSMRTPEPGETLAAVAKREIDLDALAAEMEEYVEAAKADDPKELTKRIKALEGELRSRKPEVDAAAMEAAIEREVAAAVKERDRHWEGELSKVEGVVKDFRVRFTKIEQLAQVNGEANIEVARPAAVAGRELPNSSASLRGKPSPRPATSETQRARMRPNTTNKADRGGGDLNISSTQQRILDAVAWWHHIGVSEPKTAQVGAVALIDASGGHFSNNVGPLSTAGLVERGNGTMRLTAAGEAVARLPERRTTLAEYHGMLRERVRRSKNGSGATARILDVIIDRGGADLTTAEIGEAVGIDHTGGHFSNSIGPLSTLGLITRSQGTVRPTALLFPEELH